MQQVEGEIVNEHFVPFLGLELESYLQTENKNGIHSLGRYYWAIEVLKQRRPGRVLDIACGEGYGSYLMSNALPESVIMGVDYDAQSISKAKETYQANNLSFEVGSVTEWSYGDCDAIVSFETIEHVEHREIMMQHFVEHLSPMGFLLLSTPIRRELTLNPGWKHHKIEYTNERLYDFMRRFFQYVRYAEIGTLPCVECFDEINRDRVRYPLNMMNPLMCEQPIPIWSKC